VGDLEKAVAPLALLRRRRRRRLLVFIFAGTEDFLQEVSLLRWGGLLSGVGSVAVWRSVGGGADNWSAGRGRCCSIRWSGLVAADAEDLLEEVLRVFAHLAAGIDGRGSV